MAELSMALNELLEKRGASTDFLREPLTFLLQEFMEHEVNGRCGAEKHARSDERVDAFLSRPLEGDWPCIWLDATYIKSREHGPVASHAVVVATGVNQEGYREVLGLSVAPSGSAAGCTSCETSSPKCPKRTSRLSRLPCEQR